MDKFVIKGGFPLKGKLSVSGAKNAVLPILAASLLMSDEVILHNVPQLYDVITMMELIGGLGACFTKQDEHSLAIQTTGLFQHVAPYELVKTMRASILVLGPLLARFGEASVSLPGGCAIGARPVDYHIAGMEALGATIRLENGYIYATAKQGLHGNTYTFPEISVTGTENLIMAATLAKGETILKNVAKEPEVIDLIHFLNKAGAQIRGAGTSSLHITGVKQLKAVEYSIMPDRIEAGTFLVATACTGGALEINDISIEIMQSILDKLTAAGANIQLGKNSIYLKKASQPLKAVNICTATYPGFPTDMQAQFMALNAIAQGSSTIEEKIFENRFMHAQELNRMGANIQIQGHTAYCTGVSRLKGAPVMATDLRASAGLVIAGLVAEGETTIERIYHIDRGYESIEKKLAQLGADIQRIAS